MAPMLFVCVKFVLGFCEATVSAPARWSLLFHVYGSDKILKLTVIGLTFGAGREPSLSLVLSPKVKPKPRKTLNPEARVQSVRTKPKRKPKHREYKSFCASVDSAHF